MTGKDGGGNGTGLQSHGIENGKHNGERTASEAGQIVDGGGFFRLTNVFVKFSIISAFLWIL